MKDTQFNKIAEVFHKYLDMDEAYVKEQLAQPNLTGFPLVQKEMGLHMPI